MPRWPYLVLLCLLGACNRPPPQGEIDTNNPLEATARERGLVPNRDAPPTGVFERRHDLGRDILCAVPKGGKSYAFALSAAFGPGLSCLARGEITREGDGWRFAFDGAKGCAPVLREEGDELRFPGELPQECAALCPGRASIAGLRLPRASWDEADARRLQLVDPRGISIRPCTD